jgi:hypothetical protein
MKAEVLTTVIEDAYAEAVRRGDEVRGISLYGDRLVVWVERDGRRSPLLDALLNQGDAGMLFAALKHVKSPAQFDGLFNALVNAGMCTGDNGRVHICDEDFHGIVSILLEEEWT